MKQEMIWNLNLEEKVMEASDRFLATSRIINLPRPKSQKNVKRFAKERAYTSLP
jgi:hypothetical protein